jgi:hypothetical protein
LECNSQYWRKIWNAIPNIGVKFGIKSARLLAERVAPIDARHLQNLETILDKPLLHAFVLSNDNETHYFSDKITALHAAMFLG